LAAARLVSTAVSTITASGSLMRQLAKMQHKTRMVAEVDILAPGKRPELKEQRRSGLPASRLSM
jgi:hypothetical protein